MVRALPCHGRGCGFEPRRLRLSKPLISKDLQTDQTTPVDSHAQNMKNYVLSKTRTIKVGSVHIKIYPGVCRGRQIFTVYWRIGQRPFRKVFANEKDAEKFARDKAEALAAGRVDAPSISVAAIETFQEAKRRLGPITTPLHLVADEYASAAEKLKGTATIDQAVEFFLRNTAPARTRRTVGETLAEFIHAKTQDGVSQRYIQDCRSRLGRFAKDFQTEIALIQTKELSDWLRALRCGPRSRNNFRTLIVTLFEFARKQGYYSQERPNPAILVDRAKVRGDAICIYSPAELTEMLRVANERERIAIAIGAFGGVRQAEIIRLRWENFNWGEEVIDLGSDQTKTASRRLVPILPALVAWIGNLRHERGPLLPFNENTGFRRLYRSIESKVNASRPEGQRDFAWKPNALRHSYASYRVAVTEDVAKVSLEMGNSPQKVFSNYRKVVTKSQAAAWFAIQPETPENIVPMTAAA